MLSQVWVELDAWIVRTNATAIAEGVPQLKPCDVRLLGQMALFELGVGLSLVATVDVDAYTSAEYAIEVKLRQLLAGHDLVLDLLGHEVWMPRETEYDAIFAGRYLTVRAAQADYVLLSKAAKAPRKNAALLTEYLARGASPLFLNLAARYNVDLEQFL